MFPLLFFVHVQSLRCPLILIFPLQQFYPINEWPFKSKLKEEKRKASYGSTLSRKKFPHPLFWQQPHGWILQFESTTIFLCGTSQSSTAGSISLYGDCDRGCRAVERPDFGLPGTTAPFLPRLNVYCGKKTEEYGERNELTHYMLLSGSLFSPFSLKVETSSHSYLFHLTSIFVQVGLCRFTFKLSIKKSVSITAPKKKSQLLYPMFTSHGLRNIFFVHVVRHISFKAPWLLHSRVCCRLSSFMIAGLVTSHPRSGLSKTLFCFEPCIWKGSRLLTLS